jgi:O-antigen/teichoic acid export membrane protein
MLASFGTLASGEALARLVGFATLLVLARQLQPSGLGLVVLGTTLVNWFRLVVDSGTEVLGVRDISRRPERLREIVDPLLGLRLALSVLAGGLFFVAVLLVADGDDRYALWLFALMLPVTAINLRWMVLGVRAAKSVAAGNVGSQVLILVGVLLLVNGRGDLVAVPAVQTVGELLYALVVVAAIVRRFGPARPRVDLAAWRGLLRASYPLMGNQAARAALYSFDVLVIGVVLGSHDVGLYGAAYKPILFLSGMVGLFAVSFLSAYSGPGEWQERSFLFRRGVLVPLLLTIPLALAVTVGGESGLTLAYGESYAAAGPALAILAWTIPVMAVGVPYAQVLIAADRQKLLFRNNALAAGFAMVGDFVAVPVFGIAGAASVTLASFALLFVLNYATSVPRGLAPSLGVVLGRRPDAPPTPPAVVAEQR